MNPTGLMNEQLPWHSSCLGQLHGYIDTSRIPHALILYGQAGIGKMLLAQQISHLLLCDSPVNYKACGLCHSCKLIEAETHPDFVMVTPEEEGKSISIDSIRSLGQTLTLKPHYAKYRIILVNPAHKLNRNAANALLKTLEEPGENNLFLLVCDQLESLPATVRSRCQIVSVPTPERGEAINWLEQRLPNHNTARLLKIASGSPLRAIRISKNEVEKEYELLESLWVGLLKGKIDPVTAVSKTEKIGLQSIIEWITSWLIELIKAQFDATRFNQSEREIDSFLINPQNRLDLEQLFGLLEQLFQAKSLLDSSVNRQLMLEAIFISWSNIHNKPC